MKICPTCNTEYDDANKFCLEDGTRTVDKEQKSNDPIIGHFVDKDRQYQALSLLGEGGMGKVYRGSQKSMNRDVAIKTLHKELLDKEQIAKRFRREALAASKLKHANAIDVYTFGQVDAPGQPFDGMPYMVMEFVSGKSLYRTIHDATRLDEARACKIMLQMCDVLEEAHNQGIIHRDLKPENVVLTERGKNKDFVKVLDFGIAKMLQEEEAGATKLTKAGTVFGTPEYLSPEQASGTPVDARSDIYSMGIILYEMLTGKVPFKSDTAVGLLIKHVNEAPRPIREFAPEANISLAMESIVMKALQKDPKDRQQSASEIADALRALQAGVSPAKPVVAATYVPGGLPPASIQPKAAPAIAPTIAPNSPRPFSTAPAASMAAPMTPGPQTLSPVVVQHQAATPASGATLAIILLAIFLGGGAAGSYFLYFKDHPEVFGGAAATPPPAANTTIVPVVEPTLMTPPAEVKKITLDIDSSPQGADVIIDGSPVGITPLKWEVDGRSSSVTIIIQEVGFLQFKHNLDPNKTTSIATKLVEDQSSKTKKVEPKIEPKIEPKAEPKSGAEPTVEPKKPKAEPKTPKAEPTLSNEEKAAKVKALLKARQENNN
jgi:eukaryotic-like serine/threonine-protein kinase